MYSILNNKEKGRLINKPSTNGLPNDEKASNEH